VVNEIFGSRGLHTRMVYSNNEMPLDCATLVVLFAEVATRGEAAPYRGSNTRFSAALWS
jgi:hypothetical protein